MKKFIASLVMLCLVASSAVATQVQNVKNYYKSDYKFGAKNRTAAQQNNGIVYFANMYGLMGFDGLNWEAYIFEGAENNVQSMCISHNGDVYIASNNTFGVFKATATGLKPYKSLTNLINGTPNFREVWHISEMGSMIVFQASEYIFIYDGNKITTLETPENIRYSTVVDNVLYLTSAHGTVYVLMGNTIIPLPAIEELNGKSVCSILPLEHNDLLFITETHGAYVYSGGRMSQSNLPINNLLIESHAFCAAKDGNILAVGTVQNGVIIYNFETGETDIVNIENGLQNNTVLCLTFDFEHNIWLGLERGVSYVKINSPYKAVFAQNNPYGTGYCALEVGNTVYMGTNQGLYCGTYNNGEITDIELVKGTQGQVYAIKRIDNRVFCCHHKGLYEVTGKSAVLIANIEGIWNIERLKTNPNYLVAGHYHGLILIKKEGKQWVYSHMVEGFEESSRLFEQDEEGNIWMAHGLKGVFRIRLASNLEKVEEVEFFDTTKGFKNNLYLSVFNINGTIIFTAEDGLYTYNYETGLMEENTALESSLEGAGHYYYITEDEWDRIWLLKGNTIYLAAKDASGTINSIGNQGFTIPEDLQYEYANIISLDHNRIMVSNEEGFTIVNLDMVSKNEHYNIYVRSIKSMADDKVLTAQYSKNITEKTNPEIDYKDNTIKITYGSVSFSSVKNNQLLYSTRLLGYEDEWSPLSSNTERDYTNLREGVYTFQVKSFENNVESNSTEFSFVINPPFFRTIWAYIIYIIIFIGLLYLVYLYVQYNEKKLKEEKEKELLEQKLLHAKENEAKENEIITLKNEQLESEVEFKSKELAGYTMNLVRKNEILIDIKDDLERITQTLPQTDQNKSSRNKINAVIRTINENIEHDDDWKKFEENFDKLNQDFLKRLGEQYSGLTVNDKKLCAYLKMNLVSKDIAPLLNISLRGVEIGRYRLRKKLNLSRDTNLTEFLQNF